MVHKLMQWIHSTSKEENEWKRNKRNVGGNWMSRATIKAL